MNKDAWFSKFYSPILQIYYTVIWASDKKHMVCLAMNLVAKYGNFLSDDFAPMHFEIIYNSES